MVDVTVRFTDGEKLKFESAKDCEYRPACNAFFITAKNTTLVIPDKVVKILRTDRCGENE